MNFDFASLGIIALKSISIYLFIILAIRIFGKKELSQLSVVDLVFILLISNSVQNAMVGENATILGGIAAATGLFVINFIFKRLIQVSPAFSAFIQGHAIMLVYKGKIVRENLNKAEMSEDELCAAIREHGVETVEEVDLAILEVDGNVSVMSRNYTHRTVRKRKAHKGATKQA